MIKFVVIMTLIIVNLIMINILIITNCANNDNDSEIQSETIID